MPRQHVYTSIIEKIFQSHFKRGMRKLEFERGEIAKFAAELNVQLPKNLGDLVYSFRYRASLPKSIEDSAPRGWTWIIRPAGRSRYCFVLVPNKPLLPNRDLAATKIPDSTPGVVAKYAFKDEQALLAKIRYNRLVDIFTGVTCYSLQNHLRTTVPGIGQVETDEIYVGVDKKGVHYVFPIQAKVGKDRLNIVQIEQDSAVCAHRFASLICRPVGAQFMSSDLISLFEFEQAGDTFAIASEKHYMLVPPEQVTDADLQAYRSRMPV